MLIYTIIALYLHDCHAIAIEQLLSNYKNVQQHTNRELR